VQLVEASSGIVAKPVEFSQPLLSLRDLGVQIPSHERNSPRSSGLNSPPRCHESIATIPTSVRTRSSFGQGPQAGENQANIAKISYPVNVARAIDTTRTAQRILALRRTARRGGDVQDELEPIIDGLRGDLDDTMSKSQAAKVIGVSVPTLDKWIEQRIVPVKRATSGRPRVPRDTALDLAERVADLRQRGRERNLIIALVDQLQRRDPNYQREFKKLYGPGLRSLTKGRLVSAAQTDAFGPDD
jgi:hypothetical protein